MPHPQPERFRCRVTPLKEDGFGRVELLEAGGARVARRVACGSRWPFSRTVAHILKGREERALARLRGEESLAQQVPQDLPAGVSLAEWVAAPSDGGQPKARDVFVRPWMDGEPLHRASALPEDFFELLMGLVERLHACGVCHNDLHKEPNIVVTPSGRPALIDFQLASVHASGTGRSFASRCRDDLRHVRKHARRYALRGDSSAAAKAGTEALPRRSIAARVWRRGFKPPYEFVTRRVLHLRPSEERRPNAGPWPERTPPLGR